MGRLEQVAANAEEILRNTVYRREPLRLGR